MAVSQAQSDLIRFEDTASVRGRLRTYAQGRIRHMPSRQVMTAAGSLTLALLAHPLIGAVTACIVLIGEVVDNIALRSTLRALDADVLTKICQRRSMRSAAFQASTISLCVAIAWLTPADDSSRYFAIAYVVGASVNAGLYMPYHRQATFARLTIYIGTITGLFIYDFVISRGDWLKLGYDGLASIMLAYMVWVFITQIARTSLRRRTIERDMLREKSVVEKVNAQLAASERHAQRLAIVAKNANDSVIISDPTGRIEWVNHTFSELTGYSFDEAIGQRPADLLNGPDTDPDTSAAIAAANAEGRPLRIEVMNYTKDGREIWMETSQTPIFDEDGALSMVIAIERDVTQARARAEELSAAKRAAEVAAQAKSNFLATMSHEIRTPMNGIIGMADLLHETDLTEEQRGYADVILSSGNALLQIINDILDASKLEAGKLVVLDRPFDLQECVGAAVSLLRPLARDKGLWLKCKIDRDVGETYSGDDGRLRQVLLNLIGNAIKFTESGGVTVKVKTIEGGIRIKVQDTGIGISPDRIDAVFEAFSQAEADTSHHYGGTGLGLTISQMLASRMGGAIAVTSDLGAGSCFVLELPLQPVASPAASAREAAPADLTPLRGLRVLVADDNRTNRLLVRKMLREAPIDLAFAEDGEAVLAVAAAMSPDIILMDLQMPRMGGLDATRALRDREAVQDRDPIPIIALTANADPEDRAECAAAGMNGFLSKPIRKALLVKTLLEHGAPSRDTPAQAGNNSL